MKKDDTSVANGISFTGLLAIVFITLKLLKIIDWSWWWVLSPLWIPIAIILIIGIIWFIAAMCSKED